jgi:hypothetical protein
MRLPRTTIPLVLFAALFLLSSSASAQQLELLKKIPVELLPFTGGAWPDEKGMVAHNRDGFHSPELQRGAMQLMLRSIAAENRKGIDAGWRAIDATFEHQTEIGNFARDGGPVGGPSAVAFWLCELDQAILVLRESKFAAEYKDRINALVPKIHKAARWLAQEKYRTRLLREDAKTPNRLLFDALGYSLSGRLTGDDELQKIGREFVEAAMKQYRDSDGVFLEKGGHDSSYQAVAALKLQVWITYFSKREGEAPAELKELPSQPAAPSARQEPRPPETTQRYLETAAEKAVKWEIGRVKPDGEVDVAGNTRTGLNQEVWQGNYKDVNLSEVTFCLLYHYARTGNEESLAAAKRIVAFRKKTK